MAKKKKKQQRVAVEDPWASDNEEENNAANAEGTGNTTTSHDSTDDTGQIDPIDDGWGGFTTTKKKKDRSNAYASGPMNSAFDYIELLDDESGAPKLDLSFGDRNTSKDNLGFSSTSWGRGWGNAWDTGNKDDPWSLKSKRQQEKGSASGFDWDFSIRDERRNDVGHGLSAEPLFWNEKITLEEPKRMDVLEDEAFKVHGSLGFRQSFPEAPTARSREDAGDDRVSEESRNEHESEGEIYSRDDLTERIRLNTREQARAEDERLAALKIQRKKAYEERRNAMKAELAEVEGKHKVLEPAATAATKLQERADELKAEAQEIARAEAKIEETAAATTTFETEGEAPYTYLKGTITQAIVPVDAHTDSGYASATRKVQPTENAPLPVAMPAETITDNEGTIYSDASTMNIRKKDVYISELAGDLYNGSCITRELRDSTTTKRLLSALPELLKAFALRLGYNAPTQAYREIMYFVHKHRLAIAETFEKLCRHEEDVQQKRVDKMPLKDLMTLWFEGLDQADEHLGAEPIETANVPQSNADDMEDVEPEPEPELPELDAYRKIISNSPAYRWLCGTLQRIMLTTCEPSNALESIRFTLYSYFPTSYKVSKRAEPLTHRVRYRIPLDLLRFVKEQEYEESLADAILNAITITGSTEQTQATTCAGYLLQTWPSTAGHIIQALKVILDRRTGSSYTSLLPDGARIHVQMRKADLVFDTQGLACSVIEIAEQLAWLNAALRCSPSDNEVAILTPFVEIQPLPRPGEAISAHLLCDAAYEMEITPHQKSENGQCWRNLFRNPVVVRGYPIKRRPESYAGLEIPLGMMATLAHARRATIFGGELLIKGFSTLLVAIKQVQDIVIWHLLYNPDGSHISYADFRIQTCLEAVAEKVSLPALETARHVLGWCPNVKNYAGAIDANYDIGWSGLKGARAGCSFEKISLSAGQFIIAGIAVAVGKKDKAIHLRARDDYIRQLKCIAEEHVVIYDVEDSRGWLLDGASAALHLVRASLKHEQTDGFESLSLFDPGRLKEAPRPYTGKAAAISFLTNKENLALPLYSSPTEMQSEETIDLGGASTRQTKQSTAYVLLKDKIDQICHILEQIIAYQAQVDATDGVNFKMRSPKRQLEGFNFMDVATEQHQIWPLATPLKSMGKGWIDFTRAIHAITLFGNGFGDIITPSDSGGTCHLWEYVPKSEDYLTACVSDLKNIMKKRGSTKSNPWRIADDILWHSPDRMLEPCHCSNKQSAQCDRVQVLLPEALQNRWGKSLRSPEHLEDDGAVIFGHSNSFKWFWKTYDSSNEVPLLSPSANTSSLHDSGIGSSDKSAGYESTDLTVPSSIPRKDGRPVPRSTLTYIKSHAEIAAPPPKKKFFSRMYQKLRHRDTISAAPAAQKEHQEASERPATPTSEHSIDSLARNLSLTETSIRQPEHS